MNLYRYGQLNRAAGIFQAIRQGDGPGQGLTWAEIVFAKEILASMTQDEAETVARFMGRCAEGSAERKAWGGLLIAWGRRGETRAHDEAFRAGAGAMA